MTSVGVAFRPQLPPERLRAGIGPLPAPHPAPVRCRGTLLTSATSPDGVREARRLIEEGRAAAGRAEPH
ncbi:LLM class flavin-dependent oxidoreductase, partial [Streptomyces sp. SID6139]|nr:LLM class flavin-dependent oxidoreductase [Streptomyces sp. SID6139]